MIRVRVQLLGGQELRTGGERVPARMLPRCLPLLGYMAANRGKAIARATLAELFWPDDTERDARANLRRHVHILSAAFAQLGVDSPVCVRHDMLEWRDVSAIDVDLIAFETALARPNGKSDALNVYNGDFLPHWYDDWAIAIRERLRSAYHSALYETAREALQHRDFEAAIAACTRLLQEDEWREDALRLKLTAMYGRGDRANALADFDRFAAALNAEMGVEPTAETRALRDTIAANIPIADAGDDVAEDANGARLLVPFVGRADELASLRAAWQRARRGNGGTIFVTGEAGIGKTRLLREFARTVRETGGLALFGATSHPQRTLFQPLVTALRKSLGTLGAASIPGPSFGALVELVPELHALRPDAQAAPQLEGGAAQQRIFEAFAVAFTALSRVRPVFLVVDDLHWAEEATLRAVAAIARRCAAHPLLLVATMRTSDHENPTLATLRDDLSHEHRASAIGLGGITADEYAVSRAAAPDRWDVPPDVLVQAANLGGGNPLFVTLLLQAYVERGSFPRDAAELQTLGDAIAARLAMLDDETRTIAQAAAVVGSAFQAPFLAKLTGWGEGLVYDALDRLIDAGIVREASPAYAYTFTHALLERALYDELDVQVRAERHRRIAAMLARTIGDATAAVVARHWERAGRRSDASDAYERASRYAASKYSWSEARDLAHAAAASCDDPVRRCTMLALAVRASRHAGDPQRWRSDIDELEAAARNAGSAEARLEMLEHRVIFATHVADAALQANTIDELIRESEQLGREEYRIRGTILKGRYALSTDAMHEARVTFESLLQGAGESLDANDALDARLGLIQALARDGIMREAHALLEETRALVAPDNLLARHSLAHCEANMLAALQQTTELARVAEEMLAMERASGDAAQEALAHAMLALALSPCNLDRSREESRAALEIARLTDRRLTAIMAVLNRGEIERRYGRHDLAIADALETRRLAEATRNTTVIAHSLINESMARSDRGDHAEALSIARDAYEMSERGLEARVQAGALTAIGTALFASGRIDEAADALARAVDMQRRSNFVGSLVENLAISLETETVRESERVEPLARELSAIVNDTVEEQKRPVYVCAVLARAFAVLGDEAQRAHWHERGRRAANALLAHISDEPTQRAFTALPYVAKLLHG